MPEQPLKVGLEVTDQRSGQHTLSFDSSQYPVTLNPARNVTVSEWLRRLRPVLVGDNDPAGARDPQDLMRNVGTWLWQALLPESAPTGEREALARAFRTGRTPLVLALPDTLAELPWELLCDPDQAGGRGFLARRRPLIRLIASENDSTVSPITPPLRVLLLISSPLSLGEHARIDVESERAAVEQATYEMRRAGRLSLRIEDFVTKERVHDALITFDPHIVHYIGHGAYDEHIGGVLLWEDKQGNEELLSAADLAEMLYPQNICAVVLHACETGRSNARTDVSGIAGKLVKEGIPAVLAQQANFTYESSQQASKTWYTALAANRGFAQALFEVRRALAQADRPDWAVPVLQANSSSLVPLLDSNASPGSPDPLFASVGAATDLPTPTGVFVGRHRELRALHLMLENIPGSGPVMALITGPGGIGKSTLTAQAIARYGRDYKAALTLRCQGYQTVDLFLQRIGEFLKRLGMPGFLEQYLPDPKLSTEAKIEEAVVALNTAGRLLLVIDNLESVQNEDQTISDKSLLSLLQQLLTNLRGGRVLMTGRYTVKDLLPQGKFAAHLLHLALDDLSTNETNQLLLRHPTLAMLGDVVRKKLVREFGGLPFVYDLLSSKATSQNLDLLIHDVQGRITQEHKRRTDEEWQEVRRQVVEFAALETTLNCLPAASRMLLAQLSVLYQPFPPAAIEEGLGVARIVWQPLLDWSLLRYDSREQTYHLHSTTKHYAENLLNEPDRSQTEAQLAAWYERYADRESHELTDYLEAHRLWRAAGDVRQAGVLVVRLAEILKRFGLYLLLRELCIMLLHDVRESDESLVAWALCYLGIIASRQGDYPEAQRFCGQSLEIAVRLGDQSMQAGALHQLGVVAQRQGDYPEARRFYGQSLKIAEWLGDQSMRAGALHQLGVVAQDQGDYPEARRLYGRSLEITERLGDQSMQAGALHQLGVVAQRQGDYPEARRFYGQSLEITERLGDQSGQAETLHQLGMIAQDQGNEEEAQRFYGQSLKIKEWLGDQSGQGDTLHQLGMIAQDQGDYAEARRLYGQSLEIAERLGDQSGQASTLYQLGMIAREQGDYPEARRLYGRSLEIAERLGDRSEQAKVFGQLGNIAEAQGDYPEARRLYGQRLEIAEQLGDQSGRAAALGWLGNIAEAQGDYPEAWRLYQQSLEIVERLGDPRGQATALGQLGQIAQHQGDYPEAQRLHSQSLDIAKRLGYQSIQASALHELGNIAYIQRDHSEAQQLYQQSLEIAQRLGDRRGQAVPLHQLGMVAQNRGDYSEARRLYQQSLEIVERLRDLRRQALTLHQLGELASLREDYVEARRLYQQSLDIAERLDDQDGQANVLESLGNIALDQEDYEEARQLYQKILKIFEQLSNQDGIANIFGQLGNIALDQENYEEAQQLYQQSLEIFERIDNQGGRATTLYQLGLVGYKRHDFRNALIYAIQAYIIFDSLHSSSRDGAVNLVAWIRGHLDKATFITCWQAVAGDHSWPLLLDEETSQYLKRLAINFIRTSTWDESKRFLEAHLGLLQQEVDTILQEFAAQQEQDRLREAIESYRLLLTLCRDKGIEAAFAEIEMAQNSEQQERAGVLYQLGMIAQDQDEARDLYEQSRDIFEQLGDQDGQADCLEQLGMIVQTQGKFEEARDFYQQCLDIFEQLGDRRRQAMSLHQLGNLSYLQGKFEEARSLYQHSLEIAEQLQDLDGRARCLGQLGVLAREQGNFEKALIYTIQAYVLFDALQSPDRILAQGMITWLHSHLDEETFMTHWRTLAGDRPLVAAMEREETQNTNKDNGVTVEQLPDYACSLILQGTAEQRRQFVANLVEAQQQLPPEATPLRRFIRCLAAALAGEETTEVGLLEPPFTELWQEFQERLHGIT